MVLGDEIEFLGDTPIRHATYACNLSQDDAMLVHHEIQDLLIKGIIRPSIHENIEFLSPIFPTHKSDGGIRIILNLKDLNNHIRNYHFKMDTIKNVLLSVTPGCHMASLDLKHAYHSVRVGEKSQKFLKFCWKGERYQYTCYPNGLGPCPRKFTKLMKVPLSTLRENSCFIIGYIDDFFIRGQNLHTCNKAVSQAIEMFL